MNKFCIVPILDDKRLSLTDIAVWYALCSFAKWTQNAYGNYVFKADNMFPSIATLAERAHCGTRAVQYSIRRLEEYGYIKILRGIGNSNVYSIDLLWLGEEYAIAGKPKKPKKRATNAEEGRIKIKNRRTKCAGGAQEMHTNNIYNNINNNIINNTQPDKSDNEKPETKEPIDKAKVMKYVIGESENEKRERIERKKREAQEMLRALAEKFKVSDDELSKKFSAKPD